MEEYRKIKNLENYSVSNLGNVRNDKTGRLLKFYTKPSGYKQVQLGRREKPRYVHRLVAEAFIINSDNKPQVNHKNGIKGDNSLKNLDWVTASENSLAYGYIERVENRKKRIKAIHQSGEVKIFNSRNEASEFFQCNKSQIDYDKEYKKGRKKGWILKLMI